MANASYSFFSADSRPRQAAGKDLTGPGCPLFKARILPPQSRRGRQKVSAFAGRIDVRPTVERHQRLSCLKQIAIIREDVVSRRFELLVRGIADLRATLKVTYKLNHMRPLFGRQCFDF